VRAVALAGAPVGPKRQTGGVASDLRNDLLAICRAIECGAVTPRAGAARMWSLMAEVDYPSDVDEFQVFVGMVSEIQDDREHEAAYSTDIRQEARAVLARQSAA
jgi:hypothetical protein